MSFNKSMYNSWHVMPHIRNELLQKQEKRLVSYSLNIATTIMSMRY